MLFQFFKNIFGAGNATDFAALIANDAQIVDVRTPQEYQSGHLKFAVNIPVQVLLQQLSKLDKAKPVITCCASGMRSASAKSILLANGFEEVYNGGSWVSLKKFESKDA